MVYGVLAQVIFGFARGKLTVRIDDNHANDAGGQLSGSG
tara:strand:+ start:336 stop:452 length:117 start_codon:yes stop_codon:yes gene_type:complete